MIKAITDGILIAVTDGSYDPFKNAAAVCWIIKGRDSNRRYKGYDRVFGEARYLDPYRAELHGIYCILICITYVREYYKIVKGNLKIVCDCKGALNTALRWSERPKIRCKHFDILWSIYDLRQELPIKLIPEHVYGNQDGVKTVLSRLETLNCDADHGAKQFLKFCTKIIKYDKETHTDLNGSY